MPHTLRPRQSRADIPASRAPRRPTAKRLACRMDPVRQQARPWCRTYARTCPTTPVRAQSASARTRQRRPLCHMDDGTRRRVLVADGCYLAGGAALVASAFLHWIARGAGSGLRGHALVDALVALGKHVPTLSGGRLTVVWYLVPALGAASWIAFGLAGGRSRPTRIVAVVALLMAAVAAGAFRQLAGTARLGWGPKVALLGGVLLCVGAWAPVRRGWRIRSAAAGL